MQRETLAGYPGWLLATCAPHAGQPPTPNLLWARGIGQIHDKLDRVGVAVEQRRDIGVAPAVVPDAMDAKALHWHEADLARLGPMRDVVNTHSGGEVALLPAKGIGERFAVVDALLNAQF